MSGRSTLSLRGLPEKLLKQKLPVLFVDSRVTSSSFSSSVISVSTGVRSSDHCPSSPPDRLRKILYSKPPVHCACINLPSSHMGCAFCFSIPKYALSSVISFSPFSEYMSGPPVWPIYMDRSSDPTIANHTTRTCPLSLYCEYNFCAVPKRVHYRPFRLLPAYHLNPHRVTKTSYISSFGDIQWAESTCFQ